MAAPTEGRGGEMRVDVADDFSGNAPSVVSNQPRPTALVGLLPLVAIIVGAIVCIRVVDVREWSALATLAVVAALVVAAMPGFIFTLRRLNVMDRPNARSSHTVPTVRGGGVVLAVVVSAVLLVAGRGSQGVISLLPVCIAMGCLGFVEDVRPLPISLRLIVQSLAVAVLAPILLDSPSMSTVVGLVLGGLIAGWMIGFVNVFNFMDGINGISAFQVIAAGGVWWALAAQAGETDLAVAAAALVGAGLGFLPFNFPHARVFLGDAGSYFLGSALASFVIIGLFRGLHPVTLCAPLVLYVVDVGITLFRRWQRGEKVLESHRSHVYQLLCHGGWGHARTALGILFLNLSFAAATFAARNSDYALQGVVVAVILGGVVLYASAPVMLWRVRLAQQDVISIARPDADRSRRSIVQSVVQRYRLLIAPSGPSLFVSDCAAWAIAALGTLWAVRSLGATDTIPEIMRLVPGVAVTQLVMGLSLNLYRGRWRIGSFPEALSVVLAAGLGVIFLYALTLGTSIDLPDPFVLLTGLMAAPMMLGSRALWRVIRTPQRVAPMGQERVLVYGAGRDAEVVLDLLLGPRSTMIPMGLIDDDTNKRRMSIRGVRVVGTGAHLAVAADFLRVETVVIAMPHAPQELLDEIARRVTSAGLKPVLAPRPADVFVAFEPAAA